MKNKKHIERLFQETFKDFEAKPSNKVWDHIQNELNKKERDRKVLPIWFRYAGIAAILLLFFVVGKNLLFETSSPSPENSVTDVEKNTPVQNDTSSTNNALVNSKKEENKNSPTETNLEPSNTKVTSNETTSSDALGNPNTNFSSTSQKGVPNTAIATGQKLKNNHDSYNKTSSISNISGQNNTSVAKTNDSKNEHSSFNKPVEAKSAQKSKEALALNGDGKQNMGDPKYNQSNTPQDNALSAKTANVVAATNDSLINNEKEQDSIAEEIALVEEMPKDSLTIEEAIAQTENIIDEKEKLVNRWQVYASIAPVYYNTLGEGSHLHEQFVHNPKNGEFNTSYGINVGYALNDRFTVRTGISSLNLSYDTANVILYESVGEASDPKALLRNVDFADNMTQNISALSADNLVVQQINSDLDPNFNAAISQRISYYEVPLEVEYNVINRKFNVQVIGGFSTFFLDNNEVYTEFENRKNYIGEANNINNVSFSANLGLGLDYNFSPRFKFNFEPTFKYQLNAYSNTSGNFRPYIIGVYTGFSYKF